MKAGLVGAAQAVCAARGEAEIAGLEPVQVEHSGGSLASRGGHGDDLGFAGSTEHGSDLCRAGHSSSSGSSNAAAIAWSNAIESICSGLNVMPQRGNAGLPLRR